MRNGAQPQLSEAKHVDTVRYLSDTTSTICLPGCAELSAVRKDRQHYFESVAQIGRHAAHDVTARIWRVKAGKLTSVSERLPGHSSLAFSPDGKTLHLGQGGGIQKINVYDIAAKRVTKTIEAWAKHADKDKPLEVLMPQPLTVDHLGGIRNLSFSPDGQLLAAVSWKFGTDDGRITVWDLRNGGTPGHPRGHPRS